MEDAMKKHRWVAIAVALLLTFLIINHALAMSSANYRIEWLMAGTGGGGGAVSSTNYAARITVGQNTIGAMTSTNYRSTLGYWYGVVLDRTFLPLIMR
jgi:hypothetical protein